MEPLTVPRLADRVVQSVQSIKLGIACQQLIGLARLDTPDLARLSEAVVQDVDLAAALLGQRLSSNTDHDQLVASLVQSFRAGGWREPKWLALAAVLIRLQNNLIRSSFESTGFSSEILVAGTVSRLVARKVAPEQCELITVAGLIQNLGIAAMAHALGGDYTHVVAQVGCWSPRLIEAEREAFGLDHAWLGAKIAGLWGLPRPLPGLLLCHEDPSRSPEDLQLAERCLYLGAQAARITSAMSTDEVQQNFTRHAQLWFGQTIGDEALLLVEVPIAAEQLALRLGVAAPMLHSAVFKHAGKLNEDAALQHSVSKSSIQISANRDTDLMITGHLGAYLSKEFQRTGADQPISMMLIVADGIDRLAESCGRAASERVLSGLAALIGHCTDRGIWVGRYESNQFAVVLPRVGRVSVARLADEIRASAAELAIDLDGTQSIGVTISIGVAIHESGVFNSPKQFLWAATRAVQAARQDGGNCVRIFTPRTLDATQAG